MLSQTHIVCQWVPAACPSPGAPEPDSPSMGCTKGLRSLGLNAYVDEFQWRWWARQDSNWVYGLLPMDKCSRLIMPALL